MTKNKTKNFCYNKIDCWRNTAFVSAFVYMRDRVKKSNWDIIVCLHLIVLFFFSKCSIVIVFPTTQCISPYLPLLWSTLSTSSRVTGLNTIFQQKIFYWTKSYMSESWRFLKRQMKGNGWWEGRHSSAAGRRGEQGYPGVEADPSSPPNIRREDGKIAIPTGLKKDS